MKSKGICILFGVSAFFSFGVALASDSRSMEADGMPLAISESEFIKRTPSAMLIAENVRPINRRSYLYTLNKKVLEGAGQLFAIGRDFKSGAGCGFGFGLKVDGINNQQAVLKVLSSGARLIKVINRDKKGSFVSFYEAEKYFIRVSLLKENGAVSTIQYHSTLISCGSEFAQLTQTQLRD